MYSIGSQSHAKAHRCPFILCAALLYLEITCVSTIFVAVLCIQYGFCTECSAPSHFSHFAQYHHAPVPVRACHPLTSSSPLIHVALGTII